MKNRSIVFFLCSIFILCGALEVNAQTQKRKYRTKAFRRKEKRITSYTGGRTGGFAKASAYSSIGISVNAFNYFGDLAPDPSRLSTDVSFTRPGFGLVYAKRIGARYQLRGTLTYGRVRGSDESNDASGEDIFRFRRNLDFRNSIIELGATAQVYLFENHGSSASRPLFNPYIYAGIGIIRHNPQGQVPDFNRDGSQRADAGDWVDLEPLGTEGQKLPDLYPDAEEYSLFQVVIPAGIGVTYALSPFLDLSFDLGYRHLFFDHLDDVSGDYVNYTDLGDPGDPNNLASVMSDKSYVLQYNGNSALIDFRSTVGALDPATGEVIQIANVVPGYGHVFPGEVNVNNRGTAENDIYFITSFQLTYILGGRHGRAKFR